MSLKERTIKGFSWAFLDNLANQGIQFTVGIILARLLTPQEYGLVGMLAIFLAVADTFTIGGFGEALIRKSNPSREDYSTIFLTNVCIGFAFYVFMCLGGPAIGAFFDEPILEKIIALLGLTIIINAFALVPRVPLIKNLDFKSITKISVSSNLVSGGVAIWLAVKGYGVWSLVWRRLIHDFIACILVNILSRPPLRLQFDAGSFRELFGFGSKLLVSRLVIEMYNNVYYLIIGKFFSARDLGLYSRANGYKDIPSRNLKDVILGVSFPALAEIKDDLPRLRQAYRKLVRSTMFLTFVLMFGLAAASENFIIGLIGEQWRDAVPYLQLLCLAGMLYPLRELNMNMLVIKGRSDLFLKVEVINKLAAVPVILIGIFMGIKALIAGLIAASFFDCFLASRWSGKLIGYSFKEQVGDISPSFALGLACGIIVFLTGIIPLPALAALSLQGLVGLGFVISIAGFFKLEPYLEIRELVFSRIRFSKAF
ncbi:MAG: lipopolysaccharide biosynthesis protein [Phaeodactylibacter sp.]|nr:lipopolysaccharide biosynthesis protein [Phaeodactylibacter sp.]